MIEWENFEVFITVTGLRHYPSARRLFKGEILTLRRDKENEFDKSAIAAYLPEGQIGYVANTKETLRPDTMSATVLSEIIGDFARTEVIEASYYDVLCKVEGVLDIDKMVLKAFDLYNECEYTDALELFLKIEEKYLSVLLLQYIADCYIKLECYDNSLSFLEKALQKEPDNNVSLMMYGTALEGLDRFLAATENYSKILTKSDNEEVKKALERCKEKMK